MLIIKGNNFCLSRRDALSTLSTREVDRIVDEVAGQAPLAIGEMKRNFVNAETMGLKEYIDLETDRHSRTGASADSREAFKAFVEMRAPIFKGR